MSVRREEPGFEERKNKMNKKKFNLNRTKVKFFTRFTKETRHFKDFQKVSNFVTEKMRINSKACRFPKENNEAYVTREI